MEHSQGTWIAKTTAFGFCILAGKAFSAVAERYFDRKPTTAELSELHANARLIAAAPDLLAACERYLRQIELGGPKLVKQVGRSYTYQVIKEAVEKAKKGSE